MADRSDQPQLRAAGAARSERGQAADAAADTERHRQAAVPEHSADHPEHAAGSGPGRLRSERELPPDRTLYPRQQLHRGAGRAVPGPGRTERRDHRHQCARPGRGRDPALDSRRLEAERAAVPVLEQSDRRHQPGRRSEPAVVAGAEHSGSVSGQRSRRDATGHHRRHLADRRQPAVQHPVPELHRVRQLHLAARRARGEVRRADDLRAEERERVERDARELRLRRGRRPDRVLQLHERQRRRSVRQRLHL